MNARPPQDEPASDQREQAPPAPRKMATSERAIAAMGVKIDRASPVTPVNPDGGNIPYAVDKNGSAKVCRQLMGNLKGIEANPGDKNLRAEFLARRDILWDHLTPEDQATVDEEHRRVRELVKPKRSAPRKAVAA